MSRQSGKWNVESGISRDATHRRRLRRSIRSRLFAIRNRNAVTLIELLITITIIATLSAAFLGASRSAMETSRAARTKTTIAKIHGLLMERWASYATRRVDVDTSGLTAEQLADRQFMANQRLLGLRELMKLEMPDRWSDILGASVPDNGPYTNASPISGYPNATQNYPTLSKAYLRRLQGLNPVATGSATQGDIIRRNQGAECLFLVIMLATGDGEARTLFSQQDIGDTDGDGAPEFLDGWGRPIQFSRWPAGFAENELSSLLSANADSDHDPFDHFRRDNPINTIWPNNRGYRLVPLIFSAGSDGDPDLYVAPGAVIDDPYTNYVAGGIDAKIGAPMGSIDPSGDGDNWIDNIHNHLQDGR